MIWERAGRRRTECGLGGVCRLAAFFLLSALPLVARAQDPGDYTGKTIGEVRVVLDGRNGPVPGDEFRSLIVLREGQTYTSALVRRSLFTLYLSTRVSNARAEVQLRPAGDLVVTFTVTPQVVLGEVSITGLGEQGIETVRGRLTDLERGARFSEANVRRGAERIFELARERGFYQVSVEPQITYDAAGRTANVNYVITRGTVATIAAINFTGDSRIPLDQLRGEIKSVAGAPFSRSQLIADLQALRDLHLAAGHLAARVGPPDVTYDSTTNSIRINLPINSGPIFTVRVEGFEIKEQKLREILPLLREGGVDETSLEDAARRLRDYLQEEGYFFAEVEAPPMPDLSADRIELVLQANPRQRYRVAEIRIEGTNEISYEEIAGRLRSKPESFFPLPIFSRYTRGITSEQALRRDSDVILAELRDRGFRRARMLSVNRAVSGENDKLTIIFTVEDGPRSYIGDIAFAGNALISSDDLRDLLDLSPGAPFSPSQTKAEGSKILQYYFDRGYALATLSTRTAELGSERVRLTYQISEGPLVYINKIFISNVGLRRRMRPDRVERYLRIEEGDLLNNEEVVRSEQELYALGAFRRVVVRSEPIGEESETGVVRRDVYVDIDEGVSRNLIYGGGYNSDDGARGILEVSDPNFKGRLTTAAIRLRISQRNILGQLSYTDPRPFGYNLPTLGALLMQRQRRPGFDSRRATFLIQTERRVTDRSLLLFRYNYEDVRVTNQEMIEDRRDQPVRLSRLSAAYAFDGRDNPFDATVGRYHSADFSVALRALGGNEQFWRIFTENQYYYRLPRTGGTVLAGDLRIGLAENFGSRDNDLPSDLSEEELKRLPLTERFYSGGSTTLRGYGFEQAGPRAPNNRPSGGNALIILNLELRRTLYRRIGIVAFYDGGNIFRLISEIRLSDLSHTLGLGLRVNTPLGPLRFDVGYLASDPLNASTLPPELRAIYKLARVRFHLSFGQAF